PELHGCVNQNHFEDRKHQRENKWSTMRGHEPDQGGKYHPKCGDAASKLFITRRGKVELRGSIRNGTNQNRGMRGSFRPFGWNGGRSCWAGSCAKYRELE